MMDAKRVEFLAHDGLRSFETLDMEDAILIAVDSLSAILENVTDDPALVSFGLGIEAAVRRKLGLQFYKRPDLGDGKGASSPAFTSFACAVR